MNNYTAFVTYASYFSTILFKINKDYYFPILLFENSDILETVQDMGARERQTQS